MTKLADASGNNWPTHTDDDGTGQTGTPIDNTFLTAARDSIDTLVHTATNSTITPADNIDEVVTARGNKTTLTDRLGGVIDADGALITPATVVSAAQLNAEAASSINLVKNSTFWIWPETLALTPAYWALSGGGAPAISIAGTGQTDTERYVGKYCAKLTYGSSTDAILTQIILDTTDFAHLDHLKVKTKKIGYGAWVKSSIASHARIQIDDGNTKSQTAYHTGGGGWEFLGTTHTMSSAADKVQIQLLNAQSGACYFAGVVASFSDQDPILWYPEPKIRGSANIEVAGVLTTGDGKKYITFARPIRLDHIQGIVLTDPVGDDIDIDFEKFEPTTSWQSMGTAGALIDDGDGVGQWLLTTSATLLHDRCLLGWFGASGELSATGQENRLARLNIDTVGSTTAGSDLTVRIDGVQCVHPFEDTYAYDDQGI